ncbi:hypothetical protein A2U01_0001744, partial [Trifolium medium]|nr:hypothetical protein [Trifolium medium]
YGAVKPDDCYWSLGTGLLETISFEDVILKLAPEKDGWVITYMHDFEGYQQQMLESYMLRKDGRSNILLRRILMPGMLEECFTNPSNKEQIEQRMVQIKKDPSQPDLASGIIKIVKLTELS